MIYWLPTQHNVDWAEAYLRTKWHPDPLSRLAKMDIGHSKPASVNRKKGRLCPFYMGELGPYLTVT